MHPVNRDKTVDQVDDIAPLREQIVQLARLALTGRAQDVELYLRRLARTYRQQNPTLSADLIELLRRRPRPDSPLRERGVATATPVDLDSRSPLVRQEWPVHVPVEPVLDENLRDLLVQVIDEHNKRELLLEAGLTPAKSVLFTGPPGVGKTLAARWMARELEVPFMVLDLSTVMSSFLGKTGGNLRRVLDYAKDTACVLLLDELDAIAKRRDDQIEVGELKRLVTVLLQEIDNWPSTSILVAATNHSELLDPAVWRRFDVVAEFPLPTAEQLAQSIAHLLISESVDDSLVTALAQVLVGRSFSDAERDVNTSRRASVIKGIDINDALLELIHARTSAMPFEYRKAIAVDLVSKNIVSQRRASEILKVSRDVIREAGRSRSRAGKLGKV